MKMTLLEMTQDILNDLDSDFVNSIDDTVEAQQVAQIIKTSFFEMISNRNWPHLKKLIQLDASGATSKPNYMKIPAGTKQVEIIKYDCKKQDETSSRYNDIKYLEPEAFLKKVSLRITDADNVQEVVDFSGVKLAIVNNKAPEYYTSFDDEWVVFDAFDSAVDNTMQKSKSQCIAYVEPSWVHSDDAIPALPEEAFSALLEESKSAAFLNLKQMANQKAEQRANRQQRWLSRKAWRVAGGIKYENYGRK